MGDTVPDYARSIKDWKPVLHDAKVALAGAKERVKRLKKTVASIEAKVKAGEPFPDYLKGKG